MKCNCTYTPESIATTNGITTITLSDDVLTDVCGLFGIDLSAVAQTGVPRNTRVEVTDGTTTLTVVKCNQYFRACPYLPCNAVMVLDRKRDPDTVAVFCRYATARGC